MARPSLEDGMNWDELADHTIANLTKNGFIKTKKTAKEFKEWFLTREGVGYRFSPALIWRCYMIQGWLRDNKDHFITIVGGEGSGKSTLACQMASWIQGPTFHSKQICLQTKDYFDNLEGPKYRSIILDEVILQLFSREAMSSGSKNLSKLFFIMRALNLCTLCCIPNLKYADTILKEHRTKTLIIIPKRGRFKMIRKMGIDIVMKQLKKVNNIDNIAVPYETFVEGYFRKDYPKNVPVEEYDKRKMDGVKEYIEQAKRDMIQTKSISVTQAKKMSGLNEETIRNKIKKGEIKAIKTGQSQGAKWLIDKEAFETALNEGFTKEFEVFRSK